MCRLLSLSTEEWFDKKRLLDENTVRAWPQQVQIGAVARETRAHVLKQFWVSHAKDALNLINLNQTKVEVSYAIAVMDRIGGGRE